MVGEMNEKGLHIIANFYGCSRNTDMLVNKKKLKEFLLGIVKKNNLNALKDTFYKFYKGGITGYILLAESHVSIHTWPERNNYFSFDIFVCNYSKDNTSSARKIFEEIVRTFKPKKLEKKFIKRQ